MRTTRSDLDREAENRSRARGTPPIRGVKPSDDTARMGMQALAPPGRRYEKVFRSFIEFRKS